MNAHSSETFQSWFFKQLEQRFDKRGKMVNSICKTLNIGRDATYRRLRGDTALTADEMLVLARKFNIQLNDSETCPDKRQQIDYPNGFNQVTSELDYYQRLEEQCMALLKLSELEIDYASPELPFYYEFFTPTILAFKTYIYGLTSWNFGKWKNVDFRPELIDPKVFEITDRLMPLLFKIPGRELWSVGILDITLRQIEHAVEVGRLNDPEIIEKMFDEVELMIKHIDLMATSKKKFPPGRKAQCSDPDFSVYHNELTNTNNVVIFKSLQQSCVFSTFINPNYIITKDDHIQHQMETWFNNMVSSSNVLDSTAGQYCRRYFARLRRTAKMTKNRVNGLIN
jgi:hypothetical protein